MFALEEAASFWSPTLMWRTLTATLMSIFTLLMLSNADAPNLAIPFNDYGLISLSSQGKAKVKVTMTNIVVYGLLSQISRVCTQSTLCSWPYLPPSPCPLPPPNLPYCTYPSLAIQGTASEKKSTVEELPLFALLGVLGGVLGALFNYLWEAKMQRHKALSPKHKFMVSTVVSCVVNL